MSNGPPHAVLKLNKELYDFLLNNCDTNISFGLANLQVVERRETAEALVDMLEKFKAVRKLLKEAVP